MEASENGDESPMTRGRRKQEEQERENEEKAEQEAKRRKTLFQPNNVIGPRDILVNQSLGKINLGLEDVKPEIKLEETGGELGQGEGECVELNGMNEEEATVVDIHVVKLESIVIENQDEDQNLAEGNLGNKLNEEYVQGDNNRINTLENRLKDLEACVLELKSVGTPSEKVQDSSVVGSSSVVELQKENDLLKENQLLKEEIANLNRKVKSLEDLVVELKTSEKSKEQELELIERGIIPQTKDKVTELFPEVARIIWTKYGTAMLSMKDFLSARFVCTSWSQGIDKIDDGPCNNLHEKREVNLSIVCSKHTRETVRKLETTTCLLPKTQLTIYGDQCIFSDCDPKAYLRENWKATGVNEITRLLKKHGNDVQNVNFLFTNDSYHHLNFCKVWYQKILQLVILMPHLESVFWVGLPINSRCESESGLLNFQTFPKLRSLKHFECRDLEPETVRAVLLSNTQLTSVDFYWRISRMLVGMLEKVYLPQLEKLRIFSDRISIRCLPQLEALSLKLLKVDMNLGNGMWYYDLNRENPTILYKVLQRFQASLVHLELSFNNTLTFTYLSLPELPNLTRLHLKYYIDRDQLVSKILNLVVPLQNLEVLEVIEERSIVWSGSFRLRANIRSLVYNALKPDISKLWELLPRLKLVKITSGFGYRTKYKIKTPSFSFVRPSQ